MSEPLFSFFIVVTASASLRLTSESISSRWIAAEQRMLFIIRRGCVVEKRPRRSGLQTGYDRNIEHEDLKTDAPGHLVRAALVIDARFALAAHRLAIASPVFPERADRKTEPFTYPSGSSHRLPCPRPRRPRAPSIERYAAVALPSRRAAHSNVQRSHRRSRPRPSLRDGRCCGDRRRRAGPWSPSAGRDRARGTAPIR